MFHILPNDKVIAPSSPLRFAVLLSKMYPKDTQQWARWSPTYLAVVAAFVAALSGLVFVVFIVDGAE